MKITTIADLEYRVLPEHRPIVDLLRTMMRECAPAAREEISYGILMWKQKRALAVVNPTKKDITFAFARREISRQIRITAGRWQSIKARQNQECASRTQCSTEVLH
jgi:uncharacterized protein YdhG (YjbR/CyaY superfamily)